MIGSRPAMQFSVVDLPQPEGPSSATNSPRWMVRSTRLQRGERAPKLRLTPCSLSSAKRDGLRHSGPGCGGSGRPYFFILLAPISRSHLSNISTSGLASSGGSTGLSAIMAAYSGRPNLLKVSWLSAGAIVDRHVLDGRAGIHVAVVIHEGLLLGLQNEGDELQQHPELLGRDALRDGHVVGVADPVETLERRRPCSPPARCRGSAG